VGVSLGFLLSTSFILIKEKKRIIIFYFFIFLVDFDFDKNVLNFDG